MCHQISDAMPDVMRTRDVAGRVRELKAMAKEVLGLVKALTATQRE